MDICLVRVFFELDYEAVKLFDVALSCVGLVFATSSTVKNQFVEFFVF